MAQGNRDSFATKKTFKVEDKQFTYYSLETAQKAGLGNINQLPKSMKVLLENALRNEDGRNVTAEHIKAIASWKGGKGVEAEVAFYPARVLMQDFTGVPGVVDLAAMRDAMVAMGGDPKKINPLNPVDLVIDHSVMVDHFGDKAAFQKNVDVEFERNTERYEFLKWGQKAFNNFQVVPPGTGICHQVNLEYLARVVWTKQIKGGEEAYPDTLVGTDSHTTMVNGIGVLGWGVGGIEAEAVMLGQPISMLLPEVIGFRLKGKLRDGVTATDLVLMVTQILRKKGVVGKFVEFFGQGMAQLSLADRATIANMAPEYGATCGFFPVDGETLRYMEVSGRPTAQIKLVEEYSKLQGLWFDAADPEPIFTDILELDLNTVEPALAGPKRPQDRIPLKDVASNFDKTLPEFLGPEASSKVNNKQPVAGMNIDLKHGDVVLTAITSCTNTSNPSVMLGAGIVAKKAREKGMKVKPWVKTSLAPGSQVVTEYLHVSGLQKDLDELGFNLVGYGCTTCIGNSGPLPEAVSSAVDKGELVVAGVLSGNRNFEGRINPHVKANYLASPPLVVAYALAGSVTIDFTKDPIGKDSKGQNVFLKDIWPTQDELNQFLKLVQRDMFVRRYGNVFEGPTQWKNIHSSPSTTYVWNNKSTYVKLPPYFENMKAEPAALENIENAYALAILGDSVTTDHISPAGNIKKDSPAGKYLIANGVQVKDFNQYGARRGNHEVMVRGTFANIRLKNEMLPGTEGGITKYIPDGSTMSIYDAAEKYIAQKRPLIVIAGKEYGTGSSRDWAAKGTRLLGVKAVVAESFERIHRSNLIGMGVLPMEFPAGVNRKTLGLTGDETFSIRGITKDLKPRCKLTLEIMRNNKVADKVDVTCRLDTLDEMEYYRHGGILHFVLRKLLSDK